jgi:glycosyltransferase involved in cell wall biosynthesis
MRLSIVIPALNEEENIANIVTKTLEAKENIIRTASLTDIEITVVSDGSTDNTVAIAKEFIPKINLIVFEKNRGYGAAIKEGWNQSSGDLLGFLDADGTCDPNFFGDLCNLLISENADIALGSRLNENSRMPLIRKIGNRLYSTLLSLVSFQKINDTASGMRVVKRKSLSRIMPLPDGLHFTPAMSARAILSHDLKIVEKNMCYHEREGQSKLKIFKDGYRFLNIIFKMIFLYQPYKILTFFSILGLLGCLMIMFIPTAYYLHYKRVDEWMIYRFIICDLLGIISWLLLSAAYVTKNIIYITLSNSNINKNKFTFYNIFKPRAAFIIIFLLLIIGGMLVYKSFMERIMSGITYEHWSRFVAMSFLYSTSFIFIFTLIIDYILILIKERLTYLQSTKKI